MATYKHEGLAIDYIPVADATSGDVVVIGSIVGVVNRDTPAGELGSVQIEGVFEMPKASATVFAAGAAVYWNAGTSKATTSTGDDFAGYATAAAASGELSVAVKLDR